MSVCVVQDIERHAGVLLFLYAAEVDQFDQYVVPFGRQCICVRSVSSIAELLS